jgi:hypothetical protein
MDGIKVINAKTIPKKISQTGFGMDKIMKSRIPIFSTPD